MAYTKINWQDSPSTATPLTAANLNHMDDGIYNISFTLEAEAGTWTPTLKCVADKGATDPTYTIDHRFGRYKVIGNLVYISCYCKFQISNAGNGYARLAGLPYPGASGFDGQAFAVQGCYGAMTPRATGDETSSATVGAVMYVADRETQVSISTASGSEQRRFATGTLYIGFSGVYVKEKEKVE